MRMDYFSKQIEEAIPNSKADVSGDGSKFEALVISDSFASASTIERHKMVYAVLNEYISSGSIHALTIKAHTEAEWAARQNKQQ